MAVFHLEHIKLIVCLGNVGQKYERTRHNAGFMFAELFVGLDNFKEERKLKSFIKQVELRGNKAIICIPTTMMNLSGDAVQLVTHYYKIKPEQMLVVHDDLDIELGNYKLQFAKGPYGQNGILDIENKLNTVDFWRLRIGVDSRTTEQREHMSGRDYVLMKQNNGELEYMKNSIQDAIDIHFLVN